MSFDFTLQMFAAASLATSSPDEQQMNPLD
jgi:hypothetical protein